jgi:phosphoglycolate phosphatase
MRQAPTVTFTPGSFQIYDQANAAHAVSAAGGVPGRAVMVGDSMNDIASARAAGVPSIAVPFGYTDIPAAELGADRVIDHYNELHDAVQSLLQPSQGSAIGSPL